MRAGQEVMKAMTEEELQFAISQYLDGMLPSDEAVLLEKRLAEDPAARRVLEEYRRLDTLMDAALPTPQVDWDQMANRISRAVDAADISPAVLPQEQPQIAHTRHLWNWQPMLLAASLLICATVAVVLTGRHTQTAAPSMAQRPEPKPTVVALAQPPVDSVEVLMPDKATGTPLMNVQVGPSVIAQATDIAVYYPEGVPSRPASVAIAGIPSALSDDDSNVLR